MNIIYGDGCGGGDKDNGNDDYYSLTEHEDDTVPVDDT